MNERIHLNNLDETIMSWLFSEQEKKNHRFFICALWLNAGTLFTHIYSLVRSLNVSIYCYLASFFSSFVRSFIIFYDTAFFFLSSYREFAFFQADKKK